MSLIEHNAHEEIDPASKMIARLRETVEKLDLEENGTRQIVELKRILAERIAEMERKIA